MAEQDPVTEAIKKEAIKEEAITKEESQVVIEAIKEEVVKEEAQAAKEEEVKATEEVVGKTQAAVVLTKEAAVLTKDIVVAVADVVVKKIDRYATWWYHAFEKVTKTIAGIEWGELRSKVRGGKPGYDLTEADFDKLKELLAADYYVILTARETHLSTYFIGVLSWVKSGKWPSYFHALMNLDRVTKAENYEFFKLIEATGTGVHYSSFDKVFDCDSVCLLRPLRMDKEEWNDVMLDITKQIGKPYDNLFDIKNDDRVSCVEMVLDSLRDNDNYMNDFPDLEARMTKVGNLTPQMYRDCTDFEVVFEIKR